MKTKLVLFVLLSINLFAQPFYIKISSGYGLSTSPKEFISYDFTMSSRTYESQSFSFGEGLYFNVALGYNVSSNVGVDLEFNYTSGAPLNLSYSFNDTISQESREEEQKGTAITIIPSFLLSAEFGMLKPYIKFGPILGFAGIDIKNNRNGVVSSVGTAPQNYTVYEESSYENNFVWGINAALGMDIQLTEIFAVTVEVINKNLSYSPDKLVWEKYLVNGVDRIREIQEVDREEIFEEKVTDEFGRTKPQNKSPRVEFPFSSIVGAAGIKIRL
jgi:opacity protein-like surface antigen